MPRGLTAGCHSPMMQAMDINAIKQRVAQRHQQQMAWVKTLKPTPEQVAAWYALQAALAKAKQ
jgi:hypothetical protein